MRSLNLPVRYGLAVFATLLASQITASVSFACDTPVYRYAMYRWLPAPYEVYFFYEGEMGASGKKLQAAIDQATESAEAPTNIVMLPVDLSKDKDLTGVPPDVKEAWQKLKDPQLPVVLMSSPAGVQLPVDSVSPADLPAIVDSPMRQQVGKMLEAGNAGVYILLKGEDAAANAAAEKELRAVVNDVAKGKLSLYSLSPQGGDYGDPNEKNDEDQESEESPLSVGLITLARDDAKEKWLVNCLLAIEPDLPTTKEPVVVMVYGRGRALFSCLGKGIHRDNLIQDVEFITGACSCTVKEQNPGVDLLMTYNWDAAAESLAERYGAEEGSSYDFSGDALFPELIIPPDSGMPTTDANSTDAKTDPATSESATATTPADSTVANAEQPQSANGQAQSPDKMANDSAHSEDTQRDKDDDPAHSTTVATATSPAHGSSELGTGTTDNGHSEPAGSSFRGVVWVGAGLLAALVVMFGATFIVLRPR